MDEQLPDSVPPTITIAEPGSSPARPPVSARGRHAARLARIAVLVVADVSALALCGFAAYALWALPQKGQSLSLYLQLVPLFSIFVIGYAQAGLYPGFGLGPVEILRRLSYVTTFGFLVLAAMSFAVKLPPLYSRVTFVIAFALSLVLVPITRAVVARTSRRWSWWSEPVVIIGTGGRAARVVAAMQQSGDFGYRPVGALAFDGIAAETAGDLDGVPVLGGLEQARVLAAQGIRVALLESRRSEPSRDRPMIDRLQRDFRHVVLLREYDDLPVEGLQIRNLGHLVGIEYTNNLLRPANQAIKRALDVVVASLALVASAPVMALAALLVRVIDGGPVFFVQDRTGIDGKRIAVPKIRTMRRDAESRLAEHLAGSAELRREWQEHLKLQRDPRLIPVAGRLFRHFSIDELPQLWTVLCGDMSLVGPRPFPDYHLTHFSPAFLELRLRVRPGITGLWQVTVRSAGIIAQQESYDSYYIRNWSVWLDVYVLSRTIAAVVSGRGAY